MPILPIYVLILQLAIERLPDLIILCIQSRLQILVHESSLPVFNEILQFMLHVRHLLLRVRNHRRYVECLGLLMLPKNIVLIRVLSQYIAQVLHGDRLYLVLAEREALVKDLVLHFFKTGLVYCGLSRIHLPPFSSWITTSALIIIAPELLSVLLHQLAWGGEGEVDGLFVLLFIRAELLNWPCHLLHTDPLVLLLHDLDALLRLLVEVLRLSKLVTHHVEIALHRVE